MAEKSSFKLTYATMFNPPEELHTRFEEELMAIQENLGGSFDMIINGEDRQTAKTFADHTPIDTNLLLGKFQKGNESHAKEAIAAANREARQSAGGWIDLRSPAATWDRCFSRWN